MKRISFLLISLFIMVLGLFSLGYSERGIQVQDKRIALVIGNGAYKSSPLSNPVNDANDIANALKGCNFEVIKSINATRKDMRKAIRTFGDEINKGAVGLFYYAGHGIQVNGENYLVPIGAEVYSEDEVKDECLMVSSVLRKMETAGNRLNIIILDACRNNPFGRSFRSSNMGLAKMDAPTGSVLAYATAPGSVAADGTDRNGLYTNMLLKHIMTPGLEIGKLFRRVRLDVVNASGKRQTPWESSSLMGDFYFNSNRGIAVEERPTEEKPKLASIPKSATIPKISLRKTPKPIETENRIRSMLGRHGFFDKSLNPYGSFNNDFIDHNDGTITDKSTGLMWQKAGSSKMLPNPSAKSYLRRLNKDKFAGYSDWRLPTIEELASLLKKKNSGNLYIDPKFDKKNSRCWSVDEYLGDSRSYFTSAWIADFGIGRIQKAMWANIQVSPDQLWFVRRTENYVKAVRTVK